MIATFPNLESSPLPTIPSEIWFKTISSVRCVLTLREGVASPSVALLHYVCSLQREGAPVMYLCEGGSVSHGSPTGKTVHCALGLA